MSVSNPKPLVGVPVSMMTDSETTTVRHVAGDKYIRTLAHESDVVPMLIPAFGDLIDVHEIVRRIDGLMLTGGRANIEPHHYGGRPFPDDEHRDPDRDATVLPLIRACVDEGIPVFGVCRGIQEINVALGGSLHYRIHEVPGKLDHRMLRGGTREQRFGPRHPISLTPGGVLERLAGAGETMVNSLHGQGIDRLGDGLAVEALAPDGVIEAVGLPGASAFTIGVQWHAEQHYGDEILSDALFRAFGEAARERTTHQGRKIRVA